MEILKKYLTSGSESDENSGIDIVDKLVDRFQSATRIEDRRDSLRTLRALSKKYRLEVGTRVMPVFLEALKNDREDSDSVCYSLEALYSVVNDYDSGQDPQELINVPTDLGAQFTEIFIKQPENIQLVLEFVDTYELHLRRNALRLLTVLLINQPKETQNVILQCPRAISKLVDLLSDPREALRNDALLLLLELTKAHTTIQKIVAFENTFERLLGIIASEGMTDGGVVVEDCLRLVCQLLEANPPNQILFKENNFIQRILPLLDLRLNDNSCQPNWSAQKVVNVQLTMQVLRILVSPRNKSQVTRLCQTTIHDCGLLAALCGIIMANGVPSDVLTKAIYAVADVIRGCTPNQEFLSHVIAPSEPPQPAITILLVSMVNDRQALAVRAAALYCFQSYVAGNAQIQSSVIMTLLPKSMEYSEPISDGQLLCGGLFSSDVLSNWFSAVALLHCIHDNPRLKEELLRVHLASSPDGAPISLLQQCFQWMIQSDRAQTRVGLLQLLCTWLAHCPAAVRRFLSAPASADQSNGLAPTMGASTSPANRGANLSILIAEAAATVGNDESETVVVRGLITLLTCICVLFNANDVPGFDRASLLNTLDKRIGIEIVLEQLNQVSKAEAFTAASKHPELEVRAASHILFDYTFTRLFKRLEYEVIHTFQPMDGSALLAGTDSDKQQQQQALIAQYEQKMSRQEQELTTLRSRVSALEIELSNTRASLKSSQQQQHQQLVASYDSSSQDASMKEELAQLKSQLITAQDRIRSLEDRASSAEKAKEAIRSEQDDLLVLLHDQDVKLERMRAQIRELGGQVDDDDSPTEDEPEPNRPPEKSVVMPNIAGPCPDTTGPSGLLGVPRLYEAAQIASGASAQVPPSVPLSGSYYPSGTMDPISSISDDRSGATTATTVSVQALHSSQPAFQLPTAVHAIHPRP